MIILKHNKHSKRSHYNIWLCSRSCVYRCTIQNSDEGEITAMGWPNTRSPLIISTVTPATPTYLNRVSGDDKRHDAKPGLLATVAATALPRAPATFPTCHLPQMPPVLAALPTGQAWPNQSLPGRTNLSPRHDPVMRQDYDRMIMIMIDILIFDSGKWSRQEEEWKHRCREMSGYWWSENAPSPIVQQSATVSLKAISN